MTGGRAEGHGRTSDGALEVDLRHPAELGGPGGGTNPEQLFAVGYASCFESAMQTVARRMKVEADDVSVDSKVELSPTSEGGFALSVALDVTLPSASTTPRRRPSWSRRRTRCARTRTPRGATSRCG